MNEPKISIIMGVYNCSCTLPESIESIISQTYSNWELIMCDDGSEDDTYSVARRYVEQYPEKMKILRHDVNKGLNLTLNDCLAVASGDYIARMDGDDISLPERFEKELEAFRNEPALAIVSCPMIYFDENGEWGRGSNRGVEYPEPTQLARGTVHCHAPAMVKASVIREVDGYSTDSNYLRVEDWNLWMRIYAKGYRGKNVSDCLYMMRDDKNALKRKNYKTCIRESKMSRDVIRTFHLPMKYYVFSLRPLLVGILPEKVYSFLHRMKIRREA